MTSGRDALHQIDASIADARRRLAQASDAAATDARTLAEIDQRQLGIFHALADIRLIHLREDGADGGALGSVDSKAETLIGDQARVVDEMAAARDDASAALERLEQTRCSNANRSAPRNSMKSKPSCKLPRPKSNARWRVTRKRRRRRARGSNRRPPIRRRRTRSRS